MFNKKILLVDDDKQVTERLKLSLMVKEYDVLEAHDGLKALEMVRKHQPDLVVLDILMPKLDGLKVTRLFKFDERYSHIHVVVISHVANTQDEVLLQELKIDKCFNKPIDTEKVVAEIDSLMQGNG